MPPEAPLGILLISGAYERAHYAFMLAAGAGAIGREVVLFATNGGTHALRRDWSGRDWSGRDWSGRDCAGQDWAGEDAAVRAAGVAGLDELREAAGELGVRLLACDAGLRIAGVAAGSLLDGVVVAGIPAFLSAVGGGQITTL